MPRFPASGLLQKKSAGEKITCLTAYDAFTAHVLEEAGLDIILTGDSLGNVVLGYPDTRQVTIEDMIRHTAAVRRGAQKSFITADLPFGSVSSGNQRIKKDSIRLINEAGADAVKIEGVFELEAIKELAALGINVMGHLGYLPQSCSRPALTGRDAESAKKLGEEALLLQQAGVFAVVLELVEENTASAISKNLNIPTIGIGSGKGCDGQVLVTNDITGLTFGKVPGFAKKYDDLGTRLKACVNNFVSDVKNSS
ncbi:MAG: 3-methyl-2-oxobutanoate hydroxymethyltransferase [Candidatus Margulisiibacteriota bacterium]